MNKLLPLFLAIPGLLVAQTKLIGVDNPNPPVQHALDELQSALNGRGDDLPSEFEFDITRDGPPESLQIRKLDSERWQVNGSDEIGLAYAILEIAETVRLSPAAADWRDLIHDTDESPFLATRSITIQLFNEKLEREWYFSDDFWHSYFGMLARNRFNQFTLTFGHQTNYLNPVYPWLLKVANYPNVRVRDLSDRDRAKNLRMLARIAEIAGEHGLNFVLGIWTQQPIEKYGRSYLDGFPEEEAARDYCAKGLTKLLIECPEVDGVQFRMNVEAGISEEAQKEYFQPQFDAIRACGRDVKLDIRYKGLRQETIDQALASDLDVTVSTKFWCEHMGLPFHPTTQDRLYRESRYGYGAMLAKPRGYRVVYRMWTVGSQRLFPWGDPDYAKRFAESCKLGGGEGFEIFAPLSNKGFDNSGEPWRILANPDDEYFEWEFERYWFYHLAFGRLGYNPETSPEVWKREFKARFSKAGEPMEVAYRHASQILPLLTATKLFGASEWRFWPEMSTGGPLESYIHIQPSDYGQFYAIESWKETPGWLAEPWSTDHRGYVEDAIAGTVEAKWSPLQVAMRLIWLSKGNNLEVAKAGGSFDDPELKTTIRDFDLLGGLAQYHAHKTLAAQAVAIYLRTKDTRVLEGALESITEAARIWERIAELGGAYQSNLVFGYNAERAPPIADAIRAHTGHWKDRLPEVRADVEWVQELLDDAPPRDRRAEFLDPRSELMHRLKERPAIEHERIERAQASADLEIRATVESEAELRGMFLHHRAMDQTQDWQSIPMKRQANGEFSAVIPGEALTTRFDHLYRLEARVDGGGSLWPDWVKETPYVVVKTFEVE